MHKKIIIIGASGHGRVVADIAEQMQTYEEIVFADDNPTLAGTCFAGRQVIGNTEKALSHADEYEMFVAIGNAQVRQRIMEQLEGISAKVPTLIHPNAVIAGDITMGKGTVVMAGAVVNSGSDIGDGVIINTCASVDHDNQIADFAHISVGAHLAGDVSVGKRTWVGIGTVISNGIKVADDVMLGAGSVVIRDILEPGTYVGHPVRKVEK